MPNKMSSSYNLDNSNEQKNVYEQLRLSHVFVW